MGIKTFKPTTPSRRNMTTLTNDEITKFSPEKSLLEPLKKYAGRNASGKITVRHHGGGAKRKYRIIDFKRNKVDMPATVIGIEYDPNRSANIALIEYEDGTKSYILAPEGLTDGMKVISAEKADINACSMYVASGAQVNTYTNFVFIMVFGTVIYNLGKTCPYPQIEPQKYQSSGLYPH